MKFTYTTDAKPVDGYTIRRGIHRGGFGEVYYAVSDAGKEVALKLLTHDLDTELRGVRQCLNLKHPNLITTFDVRTDADGDHWVIMEYIQGASLEDVLHSFPHGLPENEIGDWMKGLLDGVEFLHQRGIVHRDLKPANVYRENGHVKIGDVGLSKQMGNGRRNQHTEAVGTVYYMAPEVARGQYGPEVDVYSLGVMLYEMVTGRLPFDGETTAEILMKHLSARPDLSLLPTKLRPIIAHALEKDPTKRTPSVAAFREELRGFQSPETLSEAAFVDEPRHRLPTSQSFAETPTRLGDTDRARRRHRPSQRVALRSETATNEPMPAWHWALIGAAIFMPMPFLIVALVVLVPWKRVPWNDYGRTASGWWPWAVVAAALFLPWHKLRSGDTREMLGIAVFWVGMLWVIQRMTRPAVALAPTMAVSQITPSYSRGEVWAASTLMGAVSSILLSLGGWLAYRHLLHKQFWEGMGSVEVLFSFALMPLVATLAIVSAASLLNGITAWPRSRFAAIGAGIGACVGGLQDFLQIQRPVLGAHPREMFDSLGPFELTYNGEPALAAYVAFFALIFAGPSWAKMLSPIREYRLRVWPVLWTAGFGFLGSQLFGIPRVDAIVWAGAIAAAAQIAAPWQPLSQPVVTKAA